ncbi:DCC1-like thiol-disulfide oxidoreductase family protein [uncultured Roseobacter sp.]|uniref:DCC1-like thiol-disulfide oxidoreductase family protein n=1 Tax=uncultured Roseobacter sp. TaxID=114847 RepID=UPI002613FCB5|nr:DCC1-like thiol-disulfide oxidoreductase family protein [uncultured Roseobacter sp.]
MTQGIQIVYDGDCPFCSQYVTMTRLRQAVGPVELIDARSEHPLVQEVKALNVDLNEGMLARYGGRDYFGADCMNLLALLSNRETVGGRAISWVFSNEKIARALYPLLRTGRNATLRLMGRAKIT